MFNFHEVLDYALKIGVVGIMVWFIKSVQALRESNAAYYAKIDTALFGPTGNNGINSRVKQLEEDHVELKEDVRNIRTDVAIIKDHFEQ
jgi:hypothetical protein